MKKIILSFIAIALSVSANAQLYSRAFENDTVQMTNGEKAVINYKKGLMTHIYDANTCSAKAGQCLTASANAQWAAMGSAAGAGVLIYLACRNGDDGPNKAMLAGGCILGAASLISEMVSITLKSKSGKWLMKVGCGGSSVAAKLEF